MDKRSNYRLGLYEKAMPSTLHWEEKLMITKECGFDYLEMSVDETDEKLARLDYTKEERKQLVDAMWKTNVKISSLCLSAHRKTPLGSHDANVRETAVDIMEKAIDLASDLGIRIIQLAGYDVYYEQGDAQTRAWFKENVNVCVQRAAKKGILLGFETMETPFMDTVEKAMVYVHEMHHPFLGVYPDIGNLKNASLLYHTQVNEDLQTGKAHLFAAHLKETQPNAYREIAFGSGHSEFLENITQLKALGVRMFVGEFWYMGQASWKQDIKDANVFLRAKLDQVFTEL